MHDRVEKVALGSDADFPRGALVPNMSSGAGHVVAEVLPVGYARYVRVLHPFFVPPDSDPQRSSPGPARTWRSLAAEAGVEFDAEITWQSLIDVLGGPNARTRPLWVSEGRLDEPARSALLGILDRNRPGVANFLYHTGAMARGRPPLLFRASLADFDLVQETAEDELGDRGPSAPTPEWIWPLDRSGVVDTDYDLVSTYVACDEILAEAILASEAIEALTCSTLTRIA